jgi:diketogulonate reductase-like aldo/keto reductase
MDIVPAIDQLETNIFSQQTQMRSILDANGTKIMAWGPMAQGKGNFFNNETLSAIGEKYGKSATQVGLRFLVQQGIPVIPKSTSIVRMEENMKIFDFSLSDEDMAVLKTLNLHDAGTRDYTDAEYASKIISQVF